VKLLTTSKDQHYIAEKAAFLRSKGILTHTSNQSTFNVGSQARGELGLWSVLESQYDDAAACLFKPGHSVSYPLSEEEMQALEVSSVNELKSVVGSITNKLGLAIVVLIVLGVLVYAFSAHT